MSDRVSWRKTQKRLNRFVRRVHDFFSPTEAREWLFAQIGDFYLEREAALQEVAKWKRDRRTYFESTVFGQGAEALRDQASRCPDGHAWHYYERRLKVPESTAKQLVEGVYIDLWPQDGVEVLTEHRCFTLNPDGTARINVGAWTPSEFLRYELPLNCHLPLPPKNLSRDYTTAEICAGLAVLHDADGGFPRLITQDIIKNIQRHNDVLGEREVERSFEYDLWWKVDRVAGCPKDARKGAQNDWVSDLEAQFEVAKSRFQQQSHLIAESIQVVASDREVPTDFTDGKIPNDEARLLLPRWDVDNLTLHYVDTNVQFGENARNCITVLSVFEELGWPRRIDDPIPGSEADPVIRVKGTCRSLTNKTNPMGIKFSAGNGGKCFRWEELPPNCS